MTFNEFMAALAGRTGRLVLTVLKWILIICLAITAGFTLYAVNMLPPLQPWHKVRLHGEYTALAHGELDFDGYLKLEDKLFQELSAETASWNQKDEAFVYSRFNAKSLFSQLAEGAPFNRSYRLTPEKPLGQALLIHGLTDSPYSMKAMAEALHARGFAVTVLRLPGHGTLPSMTTEMNLRDWNAAVRMAARDVAARTPAGQPFYIGGYSTGGTLALQYTLDSLENPSLRRPDRVLTIAPAVNIAKIAAVAGFIDMISIVPIPVLEKVRWQEIVPEYDPYKFNSFSVNALRQVNRAARALRNSLDEAEETGRITRMPPVLTWQSVVDSTIGSNGATDVLYPALTGAQHRLVLFDVNRLHVLGSVQRPEARLQIERMIAAPQRYTLDVVGNVDPKSPQITVSRIAPDKSTTVLTTDLVWPDGLVSVGHVSLPFKPDDPVYGHRPGSGRNGIPSIGSWLLRGENGAISISLGSLTRLRSNPFWTLIDQDIGEFTAKDIADKQGAAPAP
jgi:alpha-beta hydrolase superfamily lysophospholipase